MRRPVIAADRADETDIRDERAISRPRSFGEHLTLLRSTRGAARSPPRAVPGSAMCCFYLCRHVADSNANRAAPSCREHAWWSEEHTQKYSRRAGHQTIVRVGRF